MKKIFTLFTLLFSFTMLAALPNKAGKFVNDYSGKLNSNELRVLEEKLKTYADTTMNTICVVIVDDLEGKSGIEYAQELGHEWGVGQKGKDNGIVFLIKPKTKDSNGTIAIATGYGVEGELPDAICSKIVRTSVLPKIKGGEYYAGINSGIDEITSHLEGRGKVEKGHELTTTELVLLVILIIIILFIIFKVVGILIFDGDFGSGSSGDFFDGFDGGDFGGGGFDIDF